MEKLTAAQMLRNEHVKIKDLYHQLESIDTREANTRNDIARQLLDEVEIHGAILQELYYPAMREITDERLNFLIDENLMSFLTTLRHVSLLRDISSEDSRFDIEFKELWRTLALHISDEEKHIIPYSEMLFEGPFVDLAERMEQRRAVLEARYQPGKRIEAA